MIKDYKNYLKENNTKRKYIDPYSHEYKWTDIKEVYINEKKDEYFTFDDLIFNKWILKFKRAVLSFDNGYKISVLLDINQKEFHDGEENIYELGVFDYNDDLKVYQYLSEEEITNKMIEIQKKSPPKRIFSKEDPYGEENWDDE